MPCGLPYWKHYAVRNAGNLLGIITAPRDHGQQRSIVRICLLDPICRVEAIIWSHMVIVEMVVSEPPWLFLGDPGSEYGWWEILVPAGTGQSVERAVVLQLDDRTKVTDRLPAKGS